MKHLTVVMIAAFVLAGCQDLRETDSPTGPVSASGPLLSVSEPELPNTGPATVCDAYAAELSRAQEEGDDAAATALETIIADACN